METMTKEKFIRMPAEIHIKSHEDGHLSVMLSGDAMKTAYLVTEAVKGIFEGAYMAEQVEAIEVVTTDIIHKLADQRKKQLKRPDPAFGQRRDMEAGVDELRGMLDFIFGGK